MLVTYIPIHTLVDQKSRDIPFEDNYIVNLARYA